MVLLLSLEEKHVYFQNYTLIGCYGEVVMVTSLHRLLASSTCGALLSLSGFIQAWFDSSLQKVTQITRSEEAIRNQWQHSLLQ